MDIDDVLINYTYGFGLISSFTAEVIFIKLSLVIKFYRKDFLLSGIGGMPAKVT
jgi:acid phosphatase family membrane protein YuiD